MGRRGEGLPVSARRALVIGAALTALMLGARLIVGLVLGDGGLSALVLLAVRVAATFASLIAFVLAGGGLDASDCGPLIRWLRERPSRRRITVAAFVALYVLTQVGLGGADGVAGQVGDWLEVLLIGVEAYLYRAASDMT